MAKLSKRQKIAAILLAMEDWEGLDLTSFVTDLLYDDLTTEQIDKIYKQQVLKS